jgi:hypothetical protein
LSRTHEELAAGILNPLDDHIVDILLDVASTGILSGAGTPPSWADGIPSPWAPAPTWPRH